MKVQTTRNLSTISNFTTLLSA